MANPLIISCCVVGAEHTRESYPHLPITPDEIAAAAHDAVKAGASIIHLHVRDENGKPTQRVDIFETVAQKIKDRCDCILQFSTGGAVGTPTDLRCAPLKLKPEMATLSMGTMNFGEEVFENTFDIIRKIGSAITENGCMAELEIFDFAMVETAEKFHAKGLIPKHFHIDYVLGVPGGMSGEIDNLIMLVNKTLRVWPKQTWAVAGIGRYQLPLAAHAIAMGGHVRIGVEDNIYYRKGEMTKSNAQLIDRVVRIAKEFDRVPATPDEARNILGMSKR